MREVEGIVLRITDYKENDKLIHILVKDEGILTLYGRGMNKITSKLAMSCMPYMYSNFVIEENDVKSILSLRSCSTIKLFRKCREDLEKQMIAMCMCDYAYGLAKEDIVEVYDLLLESLCLLENSQKPMLLYAIYLKSVTKLFGIDPYIDGCVLCGKQTQISLFSVEEGGFICEDCNTYGGRLSKEILYLIRVVCKANYINIDKIECTKDQIYQVIKLLVSFIKHHSSINSKGNDLLFEILHS